MQSSSDNTTTLGLAVMKNFDVYANPNWYWIGAGALAAFTVFYNVLFTLSLMYLTPLGKKQAILSEEDASEMENEGDVNEPRLVRPPSTRDPMHRSLSKADGNNSSKFQSRQIRPFLDKQLC